jgi:hypothetical protein
MKTQSRSWTVDTSSANFFFFQDARRLAEAGRRIIDYQWPWSEEWVEISYLTEAAEMFVKWAEKAWLKENEI